MTRLTASNDGFHLEGSQPFETNDHLIYDGKYSSERGQITEEAIQEYRVKVGLGRSDESDKGYWQ